MLTKTTTRLSKVFLIGLTVLLATPAMAGITALSDADMSKVTGESNSYVVSGGSGNTTIESSNSAANVNIGSAQWSDTHASDNSDHKGANDQSGVNSHVQGQVLASANALAWGSVAQSIVHNVGHTVLTGGEVNRAYAVLAVGGF